MKSIVFVATTPFAVNSFLHDHLLVLSKTFKVSLCVNTKVYKLADDLESVVDVTHIEIKRKMAPLSDIFVFIRLCIFFAATRPNAVHSITPKAGLLAMMAAYALRVPLRCHTFTGQIWANRTGMSRAFLKATDRMVVRLSSQVFADSYSQCRYLESESIVPLGGISILGHGSIAGVDVGKFWPNTLARDTLRRSFGVSNDIVVFLFVGRIVRDKGIFDLLESFRHVIAIYDLCELWVVGPDEDGLQAQLELLFEGTSGRVRWCGSTFEPQNYMASADVLVLPSYREGFGVVVIEAAACRTPAIAYHTDGISDAVVDGVTGVLVEKYDTAALAKAMVLLASDSTLREKLGSAAHERAALHFSSDLVTDAWVHFYQAATSRSAEQ
jgi:glycosyltransferase involved in cell wall biosynthesis